METSPLKRGNQIVVMNWDCTGRRMGILVQSLWCNSTGWSQDLDENTQCTIVVILWLIWLLLTSFEYLPNLGHSITALTVTRRLLCQSCSNLWSQSCNLHSTIIQFMKAFHALQLNIARDRMDPGIKSILPPMQWKSESATTQLRVGATDAYSSKDTIT